MIEEMHGVCDGMEILFRNVKGNQWETIVPADMEDGTYVIEIYARTSSGVTIFYAGVLYMSDGKVVSLIPMKDSVYVMMINNRHYYNIVDHVAVKVKVWNEH